MAGGVQENIDQKKQKKKTVHPEGTMNVLLCHGN